MGASRTGRMVSEGGIVVAPMDTTDAGRRRFTIGHANEADSGYRAMPRVVFLAPGWIVRRHRYRQIREAGAAACAQRLGGLGGVGDGVRQRHLHHRVRGVGVLRYLVPERRAEAVRRGGDAERDERLAQPVVGERPAGDRRRMRTCGCRSASRRRSGCGARGRSSSRPPAGVRRAGEWRQ